MTQKPLTESTDLAVSGPATQEAAIAAFDIGAIDPLKALGKAEEVVRYMAAKCQGSAYIATISGRRYPKVDWWTTVGMGLGLFPVEVDSHRVDDEDHLTYLATVEVRRSGQTITRASAICSSRERTWFNRDEYAIKSMATTRATGKAYRIGLSGLAVMAGLEPTPAEEMPRDDDAPSKPRDTGYGECLDHGVAWQRFEKSGHVWFSHPPVEQGGRWHQREDSRPAQEAARPAAAPPAPPMPAAMAVPPAEPKAAAAEAVKAAPKPRTTGMTGQMAVFWAAARERFEDDIAIVTWARERLPELAKVPAKSWTEEQYRVLASDVMSVQPLYKEA